MGPACGTSLSLMKRLLYTGMSYDAVYFAFESGLEYGPVAGNLTGTISPIGELQAGAKKFFSSATTPDLGVHVPTVALLLDFNGGWRRPCDGEPFEVSSISPPRNWGMIPWDLADFAVDHVFETVYPGYRTYGTSDEGGHLVPTPFGDAVDTLLSDVLPSILARYDTVIAPHRLTTEARETRRKLEGYVQQGGGTLYITASTVLDLGSKLLDISLAEGCEPVQYAGQTISLCPLTINNSTTATASKKRMINGKLAAVELLYKGGGVLRIAGVGNYAMAGELNASRSYHCGTKPEEGAASSPYTAVAFAEAMLEETLQQAALFDLGTALSWVPRRIESKKYSLMVSNNDYAPHPLSIKSLIGPILSIVELEMSQSEKSAPIGQGLLPFGFDNVTTRQGLGKNTSTQIAGLDVRCFIVILSSDSTSVVPAPPPAIVLPRLLRLSHDAGRVRTEVLKRPSFRNYYTGVVLDWAYLGERSEESLQREARWWKWQKMQVVVDFTSGTTIFPGPLRMIDDWWYNGTIGGPWYTRSMARLTSVLQKMPLVGAKDAILTLHGPGGEGASLPSPQPDPIELLKQTFVKLEAVATPLHITLHLRQTGRNGILRRTASGQPPLNLSSQAEFVRSVCPKRKISCVKVAPAFAYNNSLAEVQSLVADGTASLLLLSAEFNNDPNCNFHRGPSDGANCKAREGPNPGGPPGGGNGFAGPTEGAPLVTLNASSRAVLLEWASIQGAKLVLDAVPAAEGAAGRAAELADVVVIATAQQPASSRQ
jgi:hypothetical protein